MGVHWEVVPGKSFSTGREALASILPGATVLRIAVAYVTAGGIDELVKILDETGRPATVQAVTRATHTTASRGDLLALQNRLRAEVRAFVGADADTFHPKWFSTRTPTATSLLSGSGNLTGRGLTTNREQFELLRLPTGPKRPSMQKFETQADIDLVGRWDDYWKHAKPLASALASPAYAVWEEQAARRAELRKQMREIEAETEARGLGPGGDPTGDGFEYSRTATDQQVRKRMEKWYPPSSIRRQVYELLAYA
jgi:HKD family nuclease